MSCSKARLSTAGEVCILQGKQIAATGTSFQGRAACHVAQELSFSVRVPSDCHSMKPACHGRSEPSPEYIRETLGTSIRDDWPFRLDPRCSLGRVESGQVFRPPKFGNETEISREKLEQLCTCESCALQTPWF